MDETKKASAIGIITNIFLLILKIIASIMTGSIAIISDAINSFFDVFSSIAIFVAVKFSKKEADKGYPFGYKRAEPIVALLIAFLAVILAFQIIKSAITGH